MVKVPDPPKTLPPPYAAVARPRPGFDGKIGEGVWRVAAKKTAKKTSKNHKRDDVYGEDTTMTSELYFELMRDSVFRAIVKAFAGTGIKTVVVQQDGARPHTGKARRGAPQRDRQEALTQARGAHTACPEP